MIEATVVEYITKRRKHSKTLLVKVLVERKDKSSTLVNVPFSYTNFPALIYYNKTILIGQKVNIEFDLDPATSEEVDMRLVPWEEQETHIRETIYGLFFEAMSELYFTKEKSDAFRKEFERFDKDNSGFITKDELLEVITTRACVKISPDQIDQMM